MGARARLVVLTSLAPEIWILLISLGRVIIYQVRQHYMLHESTLIYIISHIHIADI